MGNGHILPSDGTGRGALQGYALPCGAIIATDHHGRVRGVGAAPNESGPVACSLACRDELLRAVSEANHTFEHTKGCVYRVDGVVEILQRTVRGIVRILESVSRQDFEGCDAFLHNEVLPQIRALETWPGRPPS
jgi:hypothetical protein